MTFNTNSTAQYNEINHDTSDNKEEGAQSANYT